MRHLVANLCTKANFYLLPTEFSLKKEESNLKSLREQAFPCGHRICLKNKPDICGVCFVTVRPKKKSVVKIKILKKENSK